MISFDLDATLATVLDDARQELGERPLRLALRRDAAVPARLRGDERRLRRCLQLLLDHAVSVSEGGQVLLTVLPSPAEGGLARVRFEVRDARRYRDHGGLDQAGPAEDDTAPGATGDDEGDGLEAGVDRLGLWFGLTRLLTRELGLSSSPQRGNVCWFTVTFERDDMQSDTEPQRVLVVDDNPINQKVASHMLQRLGYVVDVADNGQQAVDATAAQRYSLILMDCQMPVMDGYAATEEIRRREGAERHTPIVALTAHAQEDNRRQCLEIGMDGFVTKPMNGQALEDVLRTWLA